VEKSFSAGAIDNGSSGNRHECVVLHNLPKLCTALRFRGMGSWNRTVFSALSAICCGAAILRLERLRLVVAFDPTTINPEVVSIFSFFFGPIVLSIVIGLTAFLLSKKNAIVTI
jgi:hypothetical protein